MAISAMGTTTAKTTTDRRRRRTPPEDDSPTTPSIASHSQSQQSTTLHWNTLNIMPTMPRTKSSADRRRRRARSILKEGEAPSSSTTPSWPLLAILAVVLLSIVNVTIEDPTAAASDAAGRRALLLDGDERQSSSNNPDENVWKRQLRERRRQERREMRTEDNVWARNTMAATVTEGGDFAAPRRRMEGREIWPAYEGKHRFEECVDKTVEQCQTLVDAYVTANTEMFNNQTTLYLDVRKVRELTDSSYFKVVLRTDFDGQFVAGIFEDGQVFYPWPWTVFGEDLTVGPWDCAGLEPAACCQMIQEDVSDPNDTGDFMACFVEEPVGTENNPEREDRAIVVVDGGGKVVRAPIAH